MKNNLHERWVNATSKCSRRVNVINKNMADVLNGSQLPVDMNTAHQYYYTLENDRASHTQFIIRLEPKVGNQVCTLYQ